MSIPATASQTVGPYFSIGVSYRNSTHLCEPDTDGEHIEIHGQVFDGVGAPVPDAQLELWQADSQGRFAGYDPTEYGVAAKSFHGFARVPMDDRGSYYFRTVRPGSVAGQSPHIVVLLSMRGILKYLFTRIYFPNDALNSTDSVLLAVPEERRHTLIAKPTDAAAKSYQWDVHLQGEDETVFFAL